MFRIGTENVYTYSPNSNKIRFLVKIFNFECMTLFQNKLFSVEEVYI